MPKTVMVKLPGKSPVTLTAGAFCSPCEAQALQAQIAATQATWQINADQPSDDVAWEGPLIFEGQMTGDGRYINADALTWDDSQFPMPLRWAPTDVGAHGGAVVVGLINTLERRDGGAIWGSGTLDTSTPEGQRVHQGLQNGTIKGVSADLDDMAMELRVKQEIIDEVNAQINEMMNAEPMEADGEIDVANGEKPDENGYTKVAEQAADDEVMYVTQARMRAATLVDIPAFADAYVALVAGGGLVAGATGLPLSDRDDPWDSGSAKKTLGDDPAAAAWAFFYKDGGPADQWGSYHLPFAEDRGGRKAVWRGVTAAAAAVQGARGAGPYPASVKSAIESYYAKARTQYKDDTIQVPWAKSDSKNSSQSIVAAASAPVAPPAAWFANPLLEGPTPITFTQDGRIFGHIALWGTCHTGYASTCVQAPQSATNYSWFRTGALLADNGQEIAVGHITMDTGHADMSWGAAPAISHYDDNGTVAADVASGEDAYGIWVAGALRSDLSKEQLRALRSSPMSGDWRTLGGNLELVAVLAVNVPGFVVPRTKALVASGRTNTLLVPVPGIETVVAPAGPSKVEIFSKNAQKLRLKKLADRVQGV